MDLSKEPLVRTRFVIERDISERRVAHQQAIARLSSAKMSLLNLGSPQRAQPLVMLSAGDSWFDYPLSGNAPSFSSTDIIAQMSSKGVVNPLIMNVAHRGDATTEELSLPKQQRMIRELTNSENWVNGKPDAILFSGGGDDIAGNQFCIFLDYAVPGAKGLNSARFSKALGMVEASYLDLFAFRDRYAQGVPIFGHTYDFAIPNGRAPICAGPWLKPSFDFAGWTDLTVNTNIVKEALTAFKIMLQRLAADPKNNFNLIDVQGLLSADDWANELHPSAEGFAKVADQFTITLRKSFPGRI